MSVLWCAGHGEFRRARHRSGKIPGPSVPRAQPADHPDADHPGGKHPHGGLDRRAPEPDDRPGTVLPARGRGVGSRFPRAGRSTIRRPMPRSSRPWSRPSGRPRPASWSVCRTTSTMRPVRRRSPPRSANSRRSGRRAGGGRPGTDVCALGTAGEIPRHGGPRGADHRRRGGHRPVGKMRGGRGDRPHRDLQFRPLPDGGARFAGRPATVWRCQRHRHGDGRGSAAGGPEHPGAGRGLRDRSLPPHGPVSRRAADGGFLGRAEFSDRGA